MEIRKTTIEVKRREAIDSFDEALHNGEKMIDELRMSAAALRDVPTDLDEDVADAIQMAKTAMKLAMAETAQAETDRARATGHAATQAIVTIADAQVVTDTEAEAAMDGAAQFGGYGAEQLGLAREAVEANREDYQRAAADADSAQRSVDARIDMVMDEVYRLEGGS